jgi:hypothetical protein
VDSGGNFATVPSDVDVPLISVVAISVCIIEMRTISGGIRKFVCVVELDDCHRPVSLELSWLG